MAQCPKFLYFRFLAVFLYFSVSSAYMNTGNAAANCLTWQSSTFDQSTVSLLAVDGDLSIAQCSRTQQELNPWWAVDFGSPVYVSKISIVYDGDLDALNDLIVAFADDPPDVKKASRLRVCAAYNASSVTAYSPPTNDTGVVVDLYCSLYSDPGRYLVVLLYNRNESLSLCEVTVQLNRLRGSLWTASFGYRVNVCADAAVTTTSAVDCGLRCLVDAGCQSFNHRQSDGACQLIRCILEANVTSSSFVTADDSYAWFNMASYWRRLQ